MSLNVRPYDNQHPLLLPPCVGDFIPEGDLARVVDEVVEQLDFSSLYRKVPDVGNPPYHPKMMTKILFYGYATGHRSSRKIYKNLFTDVAFIFLAGMQRPDFRTISDFRKNNLEELTEIFAQIVQVCYRLGMVKIGTVSLDSKVFKANASPAKSHTDEQLVKEHEKILEHIKEHLTKANQIDEHEDLLYGPEKQGDELPDNISTKEKRLRKLEEIRARLEQARKRLKEQGTNKINLTDGDARIQKDKGRKYPGYRGQIVVDEEEQVIVAHDVTNEQSDTNQLVPMADKTIDTVKELKDNKDAAHEQDEEKIKLLADSGYSSLANLGKLQEREEIDPYIPDQIHQAREHGHKTREDAPFHKNKFVFQPQTNRFICPTGKELKFSRFVEDRGGETAAVYKCKCSDCQNCPHFGVCTTSKRGRTIKIYEHEHLLNEMREKLSSPHGKMIYRRRKCTVEPVFGNLAQNMGFREFLLRGQGKVRGEFSLMCIAHNLLKIARHLQRKRLSTSGNLSCRDPVPVCVGIH